MDNCGLFVEPFHKKKKKSCIRETPNISTGADRITDTNEINVLKKKNEKRGGGVGFRRVDQMRGLELIM